MKTKLMLLAAAVALSGCNSMDNIPDPSPEQEKAAQLAYEDLRDGKYDEFLDQLEPQLQTQFKDNEKLMKRFSRSIPQGEYKSKTLMTKEIEEATNQLGQYKVSYEIAYPKIWFSMMLVLTSRMVATRFVISIFKSLANRVNKWNRSIAIMLYLL